MPVLCPVPASGQGTFFLKPYDLNLPSLSGLLRSQSRWLTRVEKPENIKNLPAGLGPRVYYFTGTIGKHKVCAVLDSGRTRQLYVDLNQNQDLSDESPITAKRIQSNYGRGWPQCYSFGPLKFTQDSPEGEQGEFFIDQVNIDYLLIRPATCRLGTIRVGSRSYRTALIDSNLNGRYDDVFTYEPGRNKRPTAASADVLAIDQDRDSQFSDEPYSVSEVQYLTKIIQLQDKYFTMQVAADGASVTIEEAQPVLGKLSIVAQKADLIVQSENGMQKLVVDSGSGMLPVGRYQLRYVVLKGTDPKKARWTLRGRVPDNKPYEFEIKPDQTTSIKLGPPLTLVTSQPTARNLRSGKAVSFNVSCTDALGIDYQPAAECLTMKAPAQPPGVRIYNETGKRVSVGQFEFG